MFNPLKPIKLLPCAHCGSTDVHLMRTIGDNTIFWRTECLDCGMRTMDYEEDERPDNIWDEEAINCEIAAVTCAVNMWNSRNTSNFKEPFEEAPRSNDVEYMDDEEKEDVTPDYMKSFVDTFNTFANACRKMGIKFSNLEKETKHE